MRRSAQGPLISPVEVNSLRQRKVIIHASAPLGAVPAYKSFGGRAGVTMMMLDRSGEWRFDLIERCRVV